MHELRARALEIVGAHAVTLRRGASGCGKSTQVPQYIIDAPRPDSEREPRVLVTQPRRVAAVSVARPVAAERGEAIGPSVGDHVAGDRRGAPPEGEQVAPPHLALEELHDLLSLL